MTNVRRKKNITIKSGRPPLASSKSSAGPHPGEGNTIAHKVKKSSKATRTLINAYHQLQKSRAVAFASRNHSLLAEIDERIEQLGGLEAYQDASLTGQDRDRGGDSSKKLVEWLQKKNIVSSSGSGNLLRILEVGALSSRNAISAMIGRGVSEVKRIDLNSQEPELIEEIDFMTFPVPSTKSDKFDIVSLSLVLNFVPSPSIRGDMLHRTTRFLREQSTASLVQEVTKIEGIDQHTLPCLFLVLPLPCISNSRYMTRQHLLEILQCLGYEEVEYHESTKLCYFLLQWHAPTDSSQKPISFPKIQINPGKSRNNFSIVLKPR